MNKRNGNMAKIFGKVKPEKRQWTAYEVKLIYMKNLSNSVAELVEFYFCISF